MTYPRALQAALDTGKVTNPPGSSQFHGEAHWKSVAMVGLEILRRTPRAQADFVLTFAMVHDLMRQGDGEDVGHGARAAVLVMQLMIHPGLGALDPYSLIAEDFMFALRGHDHVEHARDHVGGVEVGVCWDADRLTRWRLGEMPKQQYLSSKAVLKDYWYFSDVGAALSRHQMMGDEFPSWAEIITMYEEIRL